MNDKYSKESLFIIFIILSSFSFILSLVFFNVIIYNDTYSLILSSFIFNLILCVLFFNLIKKEKINKVSKEEEQNIYLFKTDKKRFHLPEKEHFVISLGLYYIFSGAIIHLSYNMLNIYNNQKIIGDIILSSIVFILVVIFYYSYVKYEEYDGVAIAKEHSIYRIEDKLWKERIGIIRNIEDMRVEDNDVILKFNIADKKLCSEYNKDDVQIKQVSNLERPEKFMKTVESIIVSSEMIN